MHTSRKVRYSWQNPYISHIIPFFGKTVHVSCVRDCRVQNSPIKYVVFENALIYFSRTFFISYREGGSRLFITLYIFYLTISQYRPQWSILFLFSGEQHLHFITNLWRETKFARSQKQFLWNLFSTISHAKCSQKIETCHS